MSDSGDSSILWYVDDDVSVTPDTVRGAAQAIQEADAVLLTFEMPPDAIRETISLASGHGTAVIMQPAPPLGDPAAAWSLPWDRADVLVPNENEARALLRGGGQAADVPAGQLAGEIALWLGVPTVVVTLGASGCVCHIGKSSRRYPAHEGIAVDTTSAGDAFAATLAAHLCCRSVRVGGGALGTGSGSKGHPATRRLRINAVILIDQLHFSIGRRWVGAAVWRQSVGDVLGQLRRALTSGVSHDQALHAAGSALVRCWPSWRLRIHVASEMSGYRRCEPMTSVAT